jgi:hypothetical protein
MIYSLLAIRPQMRQQQLVDALRRLVGDEVADAA